jgi:hypothetical protein
MPDDYRSRLLHLIRLCLPTFRLEVQDFRYAVHGEDVVAASAPFLKTKPEQQTTQPLEGDIGIGGLLEDSG